MEIGPYQVLEELGVGPQGERHYLAEGDGGEVFLRAFPCQIEGLGRDRLLQRSRAVAALNCLQLLRCYGAGFDRGLQYVAVEAFEGVPPRPPLGLAESVQLADQALRGLAWAHAQGVVHGELRLDCLLLDPDGELKLDFSPTLIAGGFEAEGLAYLAPEQAQAGADATPPADLYALGVIVFQLVTGHLPFEGSDSLEVLHRILHLPAPAASSLRPEVPRHLDLWLARALHKKPQERFPSAEEMLSQLHPPEVVSAPPPAPVELPSGRRRPFQTALGTPMIASAGWLADSDEDEDAGP